MSRRSSSLDCWLEPWEFGDSFDEYAALGDACSRLANQGTPVTISPRTFEPRRSPGSARWRPFGYEHDAGAMKKRDWLLEGSRQKVKDLC